MSICRRILEIDEVLYIFVLALQIPRAWFLQVEITLKAFLLIALGFWSVKLSTFILEDYLQGHGWQDTCINWRPCHRWHLLRVMNVSPQRLPLPCTWMQKKRLCTVSRGGRGLHWHSPQLSRATCGRHCEVVHKKIMNFCDVSTHLKILSSDPLYMRCGTLHE